MPRTPIDFETRLYTTQRISAIASVLEDDGLPIDELLADAGLTRADLALTDTRVSLRQLVAVYRAACRIDPDPTLALRAGSRMRLASYGMLGFAVLTGASFAARDDVLVRFHRVAVPGVRIESMHDEGAKRYQYHVLLTPDPTDPLYRFTLEFGFAAHTALGRTLYGPSFALSEMCLAYAAPGHASAYRMLFGCPPRFGEEANRIAFDAAFAQRPSAMADSVSHQMAREQCHKLLLQMTQSTGIASSIRRVLIEQLPARFPTIEAMATEMLMEARTLRRRLASVGTTYRAVLTEVRLQLAMEYLLRTRMTVDEIADCLGYSDASNFRHAFVRWTGKTPSHYRVA